MNNFSVKYSGGDDIRAKLRQLAEQDAKKATASALRKAAQMVKESAASKVMGFDDLKTKNKIYKNIAVRAMSSRKLRERSGFGDGGIGISIGVLGGAMSYANNPRNRQKKRIGLKYATLGSSDNPGGDTWYWRFLELGTKHSQAKPFLRPAFDNNANQLLDTIVAELNDRFSKALQK